MNEIGKDLENLERGYEQEKWTPNIIGFWLFFSLAAELISKSAILYSCKKQWKK